jgi:predicted acetyltransferase
VDVRNIASQKVVAANGGRLTGVIAGHRKYEVRTTRR